MLVKCSGMVTPHFATNRSLISLNNVKVLNPVHYSSSKGTVLPISLEKNRLCKCKCGLVCSFFKKKRDLGAKEAYLFFICDLTKRALL